jgi:two-component system nitrogen regulation response regulator NtrX
MPAETILVVDDERGILVALKGILEDEGYRPVLVEDGEAALRLLREQPVDLVLLDIWLPGRDGVAVLQEIKQAWPDLPVVMMSGHGTIETAVRTTKLGAYDFIEKPLSLEKTVLVLRHALEERRLQLDNLALLRRAEEALAIVGEAPSIRELRRQVTLAAPSQGRVLVTGEHGTGKELVARNIHLQSPRRHRPFVEVNCAALPEDLVESELFGHERGAFTGAVGLRRGKFELADGGTLFFDEIGDMSLKTQGVLLRVLEGQRFERVGGSEPVRVDVRVIAASNRLLEERIAAGEFREDLFYRLAVIPLHVPPLRERAEDVPLLAAHFLALSCRQAGRRPMRIAPAAQRELAAYPWPGNVRELKNLMERLAIMVAAEEVTVDDLQLPRRRSAPEPPPEAVGPAPGGDPRLRLLRARQEAPGEPAAGAGADPRPD